MNRTTIDYGIDLGTTNSAIAVFSGTGIEIVKNNANTDITPSAVYINRAGTLWVGQSAKSKMSDERAENDVALEFKRRMGTGHEYVFRASGRRMLPEDLSAEVLKSLRSDVSQKKGEDITAAAITVPAAFELHQCEATKKAAELAGFKTVALLQEPVAAALAYGYQQIDAKAYWLVFDFGGGTFDAALIRSQDGSMVVANHGGNNFLGGSDIDWAIVDRILAPRIENEYGAVKFRRGTELYKYDLLRLKAAAESAKIELTRKESTYLDATLTKVSTKAVAFETDLTRHDVARAAEPIVLRAVAIAKRVLAEKNLAPSAVEKLIFVGGPTLAPYFRDLINAELGIPFELGVDPLTVVARGAAVFAGTQRLPSSAVRRVPSAGQFAVELIYKPVGAEPDPLIGGKIAGSDGTALAGHTVEIVNQQSQWRSGKIALSATGTFQHTVRAEIGIQNTFVLELRSPTGQSCTIAPDRFNYTMGVVVEDQPIINNLGVALADNKLSTHFSKGDVLPAKSTKTYRTTDPLRQGQSGSVIKIPIIEGNFELADRNVLIGLLEIRSENIKRDLPAGSEVEVTLRMDASRLLQVVAYVPLMDEEFPAKIELGGQVRQPVLQALRTELAGELNRLAALQRLADAGQDLPLREQVQILAKSPSLAELQTTLGNDAPDFDALLQAERVLLEFKIRLDEIADRVEWPSAVKEAEVWLLHLERLVDRHGEMADKFRFTDLGKQVRAIVAEKNAPRLRKKLDEIVGVYSAILYRHPTYWVDYFETLAQNQAQMHDQIKAARLLQQGRQLISADNHAELKNVVFQLQDLLPRKLVDEVRRGYGSGLVG
jgi:molecular chaperone DnaK